MLTTHSIIVLESLEESQSVRLASLRLANPEVISTCLIGELDKVISESKSDTIHLVTRATIVSPDFYQLMKTTMEFSGCDFVTCKASILNTEKPCVVLVGEANYEPSQVLVKRWVYQEMGVGQISAKDLIAKVIGEYRGSAIPSVLITKV